MARIEEQPNGDLNLRVEMIEEDGARRRGRHDLVVLSVGLQPGDDPRRFIGVIWTSTASSPRPTPSSTPP